MKAASLEAAGIPAETRRLLLKTRNGLTDYWREPFHVPFTVSSPPDHAPAPWMAGHRFYRVLLVQ